MLKLKASGLLLSFALMSAGCMQLPVNSSSGHDSGHSHSHALHDGVMAPLFAAQRQVGYAELKLHDDKGDLELWLSHDDDGKLPLDLPLNTKITVFFPQLATQAVTLRVRNDARNEDENGQGNIRGGQTNYFIFPGDTGADATFLMGKGFASETAISFVVNGVTYTTQAFTLRPHVHTH